MIVSSAFKKKKKGMQVNNKYNVLSPYIDIFTQVFGLCVDICLQRTASDPAIIAQ